MEVKAESQLSEHLAIEVFDVRIGWHPASGQWTADIASHPDKKRLLLNHSNLGKLLNSVRQEVIKKDADLSEKAITERSKIVGLDGQPVTSNGS